MGIDAMARVLKRAKKEGLHAIGHNYKKSIDGTAASLEHHI